MIVLYETLPPQDRRAAEKHAKSLLRTTPAAPRREFSGTMRDALDTAYKKPKNVVAVLVYDDGNDTWWSDVVFRKGKYKLQFGIACRSEQQALSCLKSQIAEIKATREHPLVADLRNDGVEPDAFLWLAVSHKQFGYKYVQSYIDEIRLGGLEFLRRNGIVESVGEAGMCHAEKMARETVLLYAPDFATDDVLLLPTAGTDKSEVEIKLWQEAASFLLARGVTDIDDREETDVIYRHVLCVPDKTLNVSSISGVRKAS